MDKKTLTRDKRVIETMSVDWMVRVWSSSDNTLYCVSCTVQYCPPCLSIFLMVSPVARKRRPGTCHVNVWNKKKVMRRLGSERENRGERDREKERDREREKKERDREKAREIEREKLKGEKGSLKGCLSLPLFLPVLYSLILSPFIST